MLAIRVMQSEGLLDKSLLNFLVNGPQSVSQSRDGGQMQPRGRSTASFNSMVWADLQALARIRPFNDANLLEHISGHPQAWNTFLSRRDAQLGLEDFPNAHLLDFSSMIDPEAESQPQPEETTQERAGAKAGTLRPATSAMGGKTVGNAQSTKEAADLGDQETINSEKRPDSQTGTSIRRSESEILNDADLWNVSETEDEEAAEDGASRSEGEDSKEPDQTEEQNSGETQEQEMAKYLIQVSPSVLGTAAGGQARRPKGQLTHTQRAKREQTLRALAELCLLRCIRPDQLCGGLSRLTAVVVNRFYFRWREDLLQVVLRAKKEASHPGRLGGSKQPPSDGFSAASRPHVGGRTGQSAQSVAQASKSGRKLPTNPSGGPREESNEGSRAADQRERSQSRRSKVGQNEGPKLSEPAAPEDEEPQHTKNGFANLQLLLRDAFGDADARTPILFLVTHSVNIVELVTTFQSGGDFGGSGPTIRPHPLGKGLESSVEADIKAAARHGDWIILENLHLAEDWLPRLEDLISRDYADEREKAPPELNPRFRLWLTSVHCPVIPPSLLLRSVKVAI